MLILPVSLEDSSVNRLPWVSISIALGTVLAFFATWYAGPGFEESLEPRVREVLQYWQAHPYLELDPALKSRLREQGPLEDLHQVETRPGEEEVASQQSRLDELCRRTLQAWDDHPLRRFSLVPARGMAQLGWLSSMFLHFGWLHLIGNLLFFYVVGAFLEDVWGRPLFLGFYLAGGLVSGACQAALDLGSDTMILGASGAVAACMGAFAFRFPTRRVNFIYWVGWFFRGTFQLRAWVWGAIWFSLEILQFAILGSDAGTAFMAHIGGFAFGVAVAASLRACKWEEKVAPVVAAPEWQLDPRIDQARAHLANGEKEEARRLFQRVAAEDPNQLDAQLGLSQLELETGSRDQGSARLARILSRYAAQQNQEGIRQLMQEFGARLDLGALPPGLALRLAALYEKDDWTAAERLLLAAGQSSGASGVEALLRAVELRLDHRGEAGVALEQLRRAGQRAGGSPELLTRIGELESRARAALPELPPLATSPSGAGSDLVLCRLAGLSAERLMVELVDGVRREVRLSAILSLAAGRVAQQGSVDPRGVIVIDLLTRRDPGASAPRLFRFVGVPALSLGTLFPGLSPKDAYARLVGQILESSGATCLPTPESVWGRPFSAFADLGAFEQACYA